MRRLGRTEFVRADIRNPLIGKVIAAASVDTVVHMNISSTPAGSGGRTPMKELNVIGTMQLLAACQAAPSVRRLPPGLRVHPLAFLPMAVLMPVAYLVLTPLGAFTLDTSSWETRGHIGTVGR